jgi:hypothetical protein
LIWGLAAGFDARDLVRLQALLGDELLQHAPHRDFGEDRMGHVAHRIGMDFASAQLSFRY